MSFSRFTTADVYTFENMDDELECCACSLLPDRASFRTPGLETFLTHLDHHRAAGHDVPSTIDDAIRGWWTSPLRTG